MGILDDAIREHLELKRQHGADSDDVEKLEKEAFGPATRPGDPEFDTSEEQAPETASAEDPETGEEPAASPPPETGESPTASAAPDTAETPAPAPDTDESPAAPAEFAEAETGARQSPGIFDAESDSGDDDWLADLEDVVEQPAVEQPAAPARQEPESGESDAVGDEMTAAERARQEHPDLGDTVPHPVVPEPDSEEQAAASEPVEAPESSIFDGDEEFGDLDLDLDDDDEGDAPAASAPAAPATDPGAREDFQADDEEEDELEDEDEDLLEETPDFLEDTPEGERLWFEQGEPKDFDFDDKE